MRNRHPGVTRRSVLAAAGTGLLAAVAGCAGPAGGRPRVALTAFSAPAEAYDELITAFQRTAAGSGVRFSESYGPSGAQSRAVAAGLPTDVVALSLAPDVDALVGPGLVDADWADDGFGGTVTTSVVVLVVRKGNPKRIRTWDDLLRPGVRIVNPNPFTSGAAKWNVMGFYGARLTGGSTPEQARADLAALYRNVVSQDKSARESLQTFAAGQGDVLLSYENEAIIARRKGTDLDHVVPDRTILIENPIAVTKTGRNPEVAAAFVDFLRTPAAQRVFAEHGYRPVIDDLRDTARFPTPPALFTIDDVGGWARVDDEIFGRLGLLRTIQQRTAVSGG